MSLPQELEQEFWQEVIQVMNLQKIRSLSKYSSLVTALIGSITLIGWVFHIELLTSVFFGLPAMRVNAALGFILGSASLWFWHESYSEIGNKYRRFKRSLSCGLAIVVTCLCLLTLFQFLFNINLGIDELLIKDFTPHIGYKYPGRMAVAAALNFLMLSSALILLNRGIYSLAQGLAFASFLISLLGVIGYIYRVKDFYSLFSGGSIAINAIIAFCILSLAILFARPDLGWISIITSSYAGGITARRLLPFVIGIPLILGGCGLLVHRNNLLPIEDNIISRSIINILILGSVIWWNANFLNQLDLKQRQTELALRQSYEQLENRVAERTTELTNANNRWQESYQLLQSVIEGISDAIFVKDCSGRYVLINSVMSQKFGKSKAEILGFNDYDLFAPELAQQLIETDQQIMEMGKIQVIEEEFLKNNQQKTYLSTKSPWRDRDGNLIGLIGVNKDITDRKQTEIALKESEERLRLALQAANQGMWDLNIQTGDAIISAEYARMLGYELEELPETNAKWRERLHPEERETVYQVYVDYIAGKRDDYRVECRQRNKTGDWKWVLSVGKIVERDKSGNPLRMLGTHTDISDRKQAELEVIQFNQNLEQRVKERTAELATANQELEAFAYSVSHDLRAPLRGIDGFSKVLVERYGNQLDEQGKHYLDRIRAGTQHMGELIEDMLMLSRLTLAEMKRVPVNLSQIAQEIVKNLSESQPERSVQWNIAPEITVLGDAALLQIALENLLSNAWKFTSNCSQTKIEFGTTILSENTQAYFVKDNGVGFDMTYVNKLFTAFQRLHSTNEFPGTGVGLAIVQRIIHRHGGNIWAEGIINQGTTFYFTLERSKNWPL